MLERKLDASFWVEKPIIGMLHLAGGSPNEVVRRAMEETRIYFEEGVKGVIVEDYVRASTKEDVKRVLIELIRENPGLYVGVNVLGDPLNTLRLGREYQANFVQFDNALWSNPDLKNSCYNLPIFGGVQFKGQPETGRTLEEDLKEAKEGVHVIVTTGEGTGIETPIKKLREFKRKLEGTDYKLVVGAGVNKENAYEQMKIVDGAIVASAFKPNGDPYKVIERSRVREVVSEVRRARI